MRFPVVILIFAASITSRAQERYSLVFLHKKSDATPMPKEQLDRIMEGHMANINRLANEGKLKAAGPFEGGGGIFILNTTSVQEANQWLSTDPGIQAKRWEIEILPYTPQVGGVCLVKEPYEMVTYHFIRFRFTPTGEIKSARPLLKAHNRYVQKIQSKGNVITSGAFEPDGHILILKGDPEEEFLASDPAVKAGILSVEIKTLWIAKGSFCER